MIAVRRSGGSASPPRAVHLARLRAGHVRQRARHGARLMPAISAKVLSARLKDLEERRVLSRTVLATTPPSVEYALTDLGEELIPAIRAIVEVGSKLHLRATSEPVSYAASPRRGRVAA